ncbi:MAG: amidohydrolase [Bacteroidota bacterium]|nr:amidohydrolase [Bacteroidota bacterium]
MRDLRVTLVQSMLHWEDAAENRSMFTERLASLSGQTDLIILPEMFNTGFSMKSEKLGERMDGPTVTWLKQQALQLNAAIYGSIIINENGRYFNRGIFTSADGSITTYDKRHLFRMAQEHEHFAPGRERVIVDHEGWRILLQVCYDLRFPVFSRNRNDYDLALYVANWPEVRRHPWNQLLLARAIENQCYVIGVNRVGMNGSGEHFSGDSVGIDPKGEVMGSCEASKEEIITISLDHDSLMKFREKFPASLDADDFELNL